MTTESTPRPTSRPGLPGSPAARFAVVAGAVGIAYALTAGLSYSLAVRSVVALWIPSGLLLGMLLTAERRDWPAILAGAYIGNVTTDLAFLGRPLLSLLGPLANVIEGGLAALVIQRLAGTGSVVGSLRGVGALTLGAAVFSNAVTSLLGGLIVLMGYGRPLSQFWSAWLNWWVGDGLGMIVVTPAAVGLLEVARRVVVHRARPARAGEGAALLAFVIATAVVTFSRPAGFDRFSASLVFPLLIWIALRISSGAAAGAVCVFSGIALWYSRQGLGPLVDPSLTPLAQAVQVYAFLVLLTLSVLVFASALAEREASTARVREREESYRAVVDTAQDGILTTDDAGVVQSANPAIHRLLGYEPGSLVGLPAIGLIVPRERAQVEATVHGRAAGHEPALPSGAEITALHRNGREVPVEVAVGRWTAGGRRYFTAIVHDLTNRRRAESEREELQRQLAQSQRLEAIGRLAGGIAHDFNNTLTVIIGNAEEAMVESADGGVVHDHLREISTAAHRSADLVKQLLGFARKQMAAPRLVDLNAHIGDIIGILARLVGDVAALEWRPAETLWPVRIDPAQLDQVITNLCVNARDALDGHGRVVLATANVTIGPDEVATDARLSPGDYVQLSVSDTGRGIDAAALPHLFEPFFTTKPLGEGTGLGLATVHGIVEQNGGAIVVDSAPGHGATFRVLLRRHAGAGDTPRAEAPVPAPRPGRASVLVVDDEPSILRLIATVLTRAGYSVRTAAGPADALDAGTGTGAVELLVTDILMPDMNGRDLAARLRERHAGLKVLFTSGYSAEVMEDRGILPVGAGFLQKPFTAESLLASVERSLHHAGGRGAPPAPPPAHPA